MPADRYTHGHHDSVLRSHRRRTAENSAAYLLDRLAPGQRLLDVGCGPGTITADLAVRVAPGDVVAVDNAPAALDACRATLAERGVTTVTVERADVYRLPYADGSFDVVHAHQVLQHLSDPVAALSELRRVCRPDGVVAVRDADYPAMAWYPEEPGLDRWMSVYLAVARSNGAEPAAGRRLLAWARAAGFDDIVPSASVWCHATPEDRAWWGGLWAERATASAFAGQAVTGGHAERGELEEIAAAWLRWAADDDGWFVVPHGEVLGR
jgi:ubiquinone/menaquinone biosynthesis C-methylase UbiE